MKTFFNVAVMLAALAIAPVVRGAQLINSLSLQGTNLVLAGATFGPSGSGTITATAFDTQAHFSTAVDLLGSTRGAVLYRGVSGWTIAVPGAATYVWTSNGTGADPTWQAATGGVTQIVAGTNVTISPVGGTGAVTINASGGGGTPGSPLNSVQFNLSGAFAGDADMTFVTDTLTVTKGILGGISLIANAITNANSVTGASATDLVLTGGSTGAVITAGQGSAGNITLAPKGWVAQTLNGSASQFTYKLDISASLYGTWNTYFNNAVNGVGGRTNRVIATGYNQSQPVATEPSVMWVTETFYNPTATNEYVEVFIDYQPPNSGASLAHRPWAWQIDRNRNTSVAAFAGTSYNFTNTAGTSLATLDASQFKVFSTVDSSGDMVTASLLTLGGATVTKQLTVGTGITVPNGSIVSTVAGANTLRITGTGGGGQGILALDTDSTSWGFSNIGSGLYFRDATNGAYLAHFGAGAIGVGTFNVDATKEASSSTDASVTMAGGLGVAKKIISASTIQGTQFTSTIATGTAPLVVASTTQVANLNAATAGSATTATSAAALSISGQSGLLAVTGLTSTNRIKTVRDAADTLLELGGNYTPTGTWTNMPLTTPAITGLATGSGVSAASTASTLVTRDANANITTNSVIHGYATTATAAGTTTLTVSSANLQYFTGTTTQTVVLPVTSTLALGQRFIVVNNSTGAVAVQSSGANEVITLGAGSGATVTVILTSGTSAASWNVTTNFTNIPQRSVSAATTTTISDAGGHLYHPGADTTARTWTIDSNANVPYPVGTAITFINDTSAGVLTISITTDTLVWGGVGTTGSRSLLANGMATAVKMTSTRWMISGTGLQ